MTNEARFWSAWFAGLMCGLVVSGLAQAVAVWDLGEWVKRVCF